MSVDAMVNELANIQRAVTDTKRDLEEVRRVGVQLELFSMTLVGRVTLPRERA